MKYINYIKQLVQWFRGRKLQNTSEKIKKKEESGNKRFSFAMKRGKLQVNLEYAESKKENTESLKEIPINPINSKGEILKGTIKLRPTQFQKAILYGKGPMIKTFIVGIRDRGEIESSFLARDDRGCTVLHYAVCSGKKRPVVMLIEEAEQISPDFLKAFINIQDNEGKTALSYAVDGIIWKFPD
jgi:hypothetical protein